MCCGEIFDSVTFVWSADVLLERGRWMMVSSESFGKFSMIVITVNSEVKFELQLFKIGLGI
jgi:hypothetical protein